MSHISTAAAKALNIMQSDVYKASHVIYVNDINREFGVINICREALKVFQDTITVPHGNDLSREADEMRRFLSAGGLMSGQRWPRRDWHDLRSSGINLENLKLASGFELVLKAALVEKGHIVQRITARNGLYKALASLQKSQPIPVSDITAIDDFRFDGALNYLPGLEASTLNFSLLTQETAYRAVLGCSNDELDVVDEVRQLRNQIHFPGDVVETPKLQALGEGFRTFVVKFINDHLIDRADSLQRKHNFRVGEFSKII